MVTHRKPSYSYMEVVVALTIISVLVAIAIDRLMPLPADAERTALENTVGALRSALGIKVAEYLSRSDYAGLHSVEGSNPMEFLAQQPKNYRGTRSGGSVADIEAGQWAFDADRRTLVYRVLHEQDFRGDRAPYAHVRFKVELVFDDQNANHAFDPGVDIVGGARLAALVPYHWTDPRKQNPPLEK